MSIDIFTKRQVTLTGYSTFHTYVNIIEISVAKLPRVISVVQACIRLWSNFQRIMRENNRSAIIVLCTSVNKILESDLKT